ncbi:MAG: endolytic transglycosylase MltG, partial [Actinomycetota bacterium]|nr:endolytic transglycosylase MltG [Actinomycetota bacterium]
PGATRSASGGEPSGRHLPRVLAVAGLLAIALLLYLANATLQPFHGEGRGAVRVSVPAGADAGRIGDILAERGVVDSGRFFTLNATITGRRGNLRPGNYTLPRDMSYGDAIGALAEGPKAKVIKTYDLTIPEGRSARETDVKIEKTDMEGDYLSATRSPAALKAARKLGLPRNVRTTEGFLFPATYKLPEGTTARELVQRQLQGFADNTADISYARARRGNLTRYEVLIIASMIEREVQLDRERPLVAAVIYNRLKAGMTLGIDATIRYATNNWTRPLRVSELEADSPYNTRLRRGLPPTPIGNPGLASIKAAAKPANVDFLYYVVKPGSKGAHAFSETDAEFQADVQRYNRARESSGGAP